MNVYAVPADLEARWRPLTEAEQNRAEVLLEDASLRVLRRFPSIPSRIVDETLAAQEVTAVVCGMVKRAMVAGEQDGVTQRTEVKGPFTESVQYANPLGSLYFTSDDLAVLSDGSGNARVRSIRLTSYGDV